ncbi:hypothetical protein DFH11DRAFT_1618765 [Phellopilus nigrolimitatus]|nr:hypothetical protein DFH11DRAFT_1618765 [Phellopilus nigrolimitatus]
MADPLPASAAPAAPAPVAHAAAAHAGPSRPYARHEIEGLGKFKLGSAPPKGNTYKSRFHALREQYDVVTSRQADLTRELALASARLKAVQAENDLLLDAMQIVTPTQPALVEILQQIAPSPPPPLAPSPGPGPTPNGHAPADAPADADADAIAAANGIENEVVVVENGIENGSGNGGRNGNGAGMNGHANGARPAPEEDYPMDGAAVPNGR